MFNLLGNCIFSDYVIWRCFNGGVVMETLEQLKDIVKNAQEGATHFDEDGYLMFSDGDYYHVSSLKPDLWVVCEYDETPIQDARSLSDIKRIIELMEENKELYEESAKDKGL